MNYIEINYGPRTKALEFLGGQVFQEPQEIGYAKFVRIGKLVVVSPDGDPVSHQRIISELGLGAGDKQKFILNVRRLADIGSVQIDAGEIEISLREKKLF